MLQMTVELNSLTTADKGQWIARGRARVTGTKSRIWIELRFEPERSDVWDEAYTRMLDVLDIA